MTSTDASLTDYMCDKETLVAMASSLSSSIGAQDQMSPEERATDVIRRTAAVFPPEKIAMTFNGGKDAVVTFELLLRTLGIEWIKKCCVFVLLVNEDEFPELAAFRKDYIATRVPGVELHEVESKDGMVNGLWRALKQFGFSAVFMGTRKDDPGGKYQTVPWMMTTLGWPPMVRVCPILSWTFRDVWAFTRENNIPSCCLYAQGYTSLGASKITTPNASLRQRDGSYGPAWTLARDADERAGRVDAAPTNTTLPVHASKT